MERVLFRAFSTTAEGKNLYKMEDAIYLEDSFSKTGTIDFWDPVTY